MRCFLVAGDSCVVWHASKVTGSVLLTSGWISVGHFFAIVLSLVHLLCGCSFSLVTGSGKAAAGGPGNVGAVVCTWRDQNQPYQSFCLELGTVGF